MPRPTPAVGAPADTGPWPKRAWAYWLVAAVTGVALLVSFQQVVSAVVHQGQTRRQAHADHAQAVWRCQALRGAPERLDCLARLAATAPPGVGLLPPAGGSLQSGR